MKQDDARWATPESDGSLQVAEVAGCGFGQLPKTDDLTHNPLPLGF